MEFKISEQHINSILNYLGRQPFADVFQLIENLRTLEKIVPAKNDQKP